MFHYSKVPGRHRCAKRWRRRWPYDSGVATNAVNSSRSTVTVSSPSGSRRAGSWFRKCERKFIIDRFLYYPLCFFVSLSLLYSFFPVTFIYPLTLLSFYLSISFSILSICISFCNSLLYSLSLSLYSPPLSSLMLRSFSSSLSITLFVSFVS